MGMIPMGMIHLNEIADDYNEASMSRQTDTAPIGGAEERERSCFGSQKNDYFMNKWFYSHKKRRLLIVYSRRAFTQLLYRVNIDQSRSERLVKDIIYFRILNEAGDDRYDRYRWSTTTSFIN